MATSKKAPQFELTERAKLSARARVITVKKGEFRKGWEAVDDSVIEDIRASDEACIASYREQLRNGIL